MYDANAQHRRGTTPVPQVWLKQPLVVLEDIVERHDAVEAFATDPELRERLRDQSFRGALTGPTACSPHALRLLALWAPSCNMVGSVAGPAFKLPVNHTDALCSQRAMCLLRSQVQFGSSGRCSCVNNHENSSSSQACPTWSG